MNNLIFDRTTYSWHSCLLVPILPALSFSEPTAIHHPLHPYTSLSNNAFQISDSWLSDRKVWSYHILDTLSIHQLSSTVSSSMLWASSMILSLLILPQSVNDNTYYSLLLFWFYYLILIQDIPYRIVCRWIEQLLLRHIPIICHCRSYIYLTSNNLLYKCSQFISIFTISFCKRLWIFSTLSKDQWYIVDFFRLLLILYIFYRKHIYYHRPKVNYCITDIIFLYKFSI